MKSMDTSIARFFERQQERQVAMSLLPEGEDPELNYASLREILNQTKS
jgi:hypothetical protein